MCFNSTWDIYLWFFFSLIYYTCLFGGHIFISLLGRTTTSHIPSPRWLKLTVGQSNLSYQRDAKIAENQSQKTLKTALMPIYSYELVGWAWHVWLLGLCTGGTQRSYTRWLYKIIYRTEMKFWAVLGSRGCREKKLPTAISMQIFWVVFSTFCGQKLVTLS